MAQAAPSSSLFDSASTWLHEPRLAFATFVKSQAYLDSNRAPQSEDAQNRVVRDHSAKVYEIMFNRFQTFLEDELQKTFVQAQPEDLDRFFNVALSENARETVLRYTRLLERAYDHAIELGAVKINPVTVVASAGKIGGKPGEPALDVSIDQVRDLLQWLGQHVAIQLSVEEKMLAARQSGSSALAGPMDADDSLAGKRPWRVARDLAIAALCLGAGLRSAEIVKMKCSQITYLPSATEAERFVFEIPPAASAETVHWHRAVLDGAGVRAFETWWRFRNGPMLEILKDKGNQVLFPAGATGKHLDHKTVFVNLKAAGELAVKQGALDEDARWVMEGGARALRRAYILAGLSRGESPDLLTERLGHWRRRSVRKYVKAAPLAQPAAGKTRPH